MPLVAVSGVLSYLHGRRNYLESDLAKADGLVFVSHCPEYFNFRFDERYYSPIVYSNRYPLYIRRGDRRVSPLWYMDYRRDSHRRSVCTASIADTYRDRDRLHRYRFGPSTTQSIYPYGILRADLRHKLPLGYVPWYLPGSPTNLQRW